MQKIFNSVIFITTLSLSFGLFSDEEDDATHRGAIEAILLSGKKGEISWVTYKILFLSIIFRVFIS